MLVWIAQGAAEQAVSPSLLNLLLGGGLVATTIAGYKFVVSLRLTERGMRSQATRDRRNAQHEAALWQARSATLEYHLLRKGMSVPPMDPELSKILAASEEDVPVPSWDDAKRANERTDP